MAHVLHAIIGPGAVVRGFADRWQHFARVVSLPQDFAIVPMTIVLCETITELANVKKAPLYPEFERLSAGVDRVLIETSHVGPLGYIETEYFGGSGFQMGIAWSKGKVSLGPVRSETAWKGSEQITHPTAKTAINQVLASLGVWTKDEHDEFDMLFLGRLRDTDKVAQKPA